MSYSIEFQTNFDKQHFLKDYHIKNKQLCRQQHKYKNILCKKLISRKATILDASYVEANKRLQAERDDLRARIWVSDGAVHKYRNKKDLKEIQCYRQCQEYLAEDIHYLKEAIKNIERGISCTMKDIYNLNRKTVANTAHKHFVEKTRKKLQMVENKYETGVIQECKLMTINNKLRQEVIANIMYRSYFNDTFLKYVHTLNTDKKYLLELIEHALLGYNNCIEEYDKMEYHAKRYQQDNSLRKTEIVNIMRNRSGAMDRKDFLQVKAKHRDVADIPEKEYRRRDAFREKHIQKINLFQEVLENILKYTNSTDLYKAAVKYQQQKRLYYSYFKFSNDLSNQMTLLDNSVNRLYKEIKNHKHDVIENILRDSKLAEELESILEVKTSRSKELQEKRDTYDKRFQTFFATLSEIFRTCEVDLKPLKCILGHNETINLVNMRRCIKMLERQLYNIISYVYVSERGKKDNYKFVIQDFLNYFDSTTPLNDIVVTQQCSECAEGEITHLTDNTEIINPISKEDAQKILYEKSKQPEMQYLLHNVSQCRLPRSRLIAHNKKL